MKFGISRPSSLIRRDRCRFRLRMDSSLCPPLNLRLLGRSLLVELYREHFADFFGWQRIHY
jgi:hypothetical protein